MQKRSDTKISDKIILEAFFMIFRTIFNGISDEYNLLHKFWNVTYFEDLQNVAVYAECF